MNRPPRHRRNPHRLAATQLAALGTCEIRVLLDARHGEAVTPAQAVAREEGIKEHARFDRVVRSEHNVGLPARRPGPCWIASVAYGGSDPRTNELRRFRDRVLRRHPWGRSLVAVYYRSAPPVAEWLAQHAAAAWMVRRGLDGIRLLITPWTGENDGREYSERTADRLHQF